MTTENDDKKTIDLDTLTDEEFMKLEQPLESTVEKTNDEENNNESNASASPAGDSTDAGDQGSTSESSGSGSEEGEQSTSLTDEEKTAAAEKEDLTDEQKVEAETKAAADAAEAEKAKGVNDDKETLKLKEQGDMTPTEEEQKVAAEKLQQEEDAEKIVEAKSFYDKVSAPFKADGKEVQVRTPEEAIRLMQMGINYSRRMKEMKPLREMDAMLTEHGLNSPDKLNELIDLSKGSKEAIQKYLKKHNIDPLDLNMEKAEAHTTPNYQSDPKDVAFQEAIDTTLQAEGGKELLSDVNRDWDTQSKEALRNNPSIFGKLLEQKDIGVYDQIQKELQHQRTMGYLANVPFLEAYEQVGNAMKKAGVFDTKDDQRTGMAPIASGSRKVAKKSKSEQPNPNLSSASKSRTAASNKDSAPNEPDYLSMSDKDFMNLAPPV